MNSFWPFVKGQEDKLKDIKRESAPTGTVTRSPPPTRTATGKVSFEADIMKTELKTVKGDGWLLKRDLDRMATESRTPWQRSPILRICYVSH